jgi:ubiquinone biosynthesis protein UbiJ
LTKELSICHDSIANLRNKNASLNAKIDKLNEPISSLRTENDSLISMAKELNVCNDSISCLRNENAILHAKIDELNVCKSSTSTVDHVTIYTRCWGLVLKCYELRTRQHKVLNVNVLRP